MPNHFTPRVFVSAVSSDLSSARKVVNEALTRIQCLPVEESVFGTEYGAIREMLRRKIGSCQAVLHLVGRAYGGSPNPKLSAQRHVLRSWTQLEYDLAKELGKKLYIVVCDRDFPFDPAAQPEPAEMIALQDAHRTAILAGSDLWHTAYSMEELRRDVENLKVPLDEIRDELRRQQFRLRLQNALAAATVVLVLIGVVYGLSQLGSKVDDTGAAVEKLPGKIDEAQQEIIGQLTAPDRLADRIRSEIRETADEKIATIPPDDAGRVQKIIEIEQDRDTQLSRVDDLIQLIQVGLQEGAGEVFQRAVEILNQTQHGGTDAAITYLESRRKSTLEVAGRHKRQVDEKKRQLEGEREKRNRHLKSLVLQAELLESKLDWPAALELRQQIAEFAPDWFDARNRLGILLDELGKYGEAEIEWRAARANASNGKEEAIALNNLAHLLQTMDRRSEAEPLMREALATAIETFGADSFEIATYLNNLGTLLSQTARYSEAEHHFRRALALREAALGANNPAVAEILSNLGLLLKHTGRLQYAEPLYRRSFAIDEHTYGSEHPNVAIRLSMLAKLLEDTGRVNHAEPLVRRALTIAESTYGSKHPTAALRLNNLGALYRVMNRFTDAEPLLRRAIAIDESHFGPRHSDVGADLANLAALLLSTKRSSEAELLFRRVLSIDLLSFDDEHWYVAGDLNNLAMCLQASNRWQQAEPLLRKAVVIDEKTFGPEHPKVAIHLDKLADLLRATKRVSQAKLLSKRSVEIFVLSGKATGHEDRHYRKAKDGYAEILKALDLPQEQIEQHLASVATVEGPLEPIVPEVEVLLGPTEPVAEVLAKLDRQYREEGKPAIYFLPLDQPIAPHIEQILGPSPLNIPLDQPISPRLNGLLGPAKTVQEVLDQLDAEYRHQGKSAIWFLPFNEPISPHLEGLLGPLQGKATPD